MWPLEGMPKSLYYIAKYFSIVTYPISCFSDIVQKGFGLEHEKVWIGIAHAIFYSTIFIVIGIKLLSKKKFMN